MSALRLSAFLVAAACMAALAACEGQRSDTVRLGEILYHKVLGIGGTEEVSRDRVAAIPFATLGVEFASSDQAMFVLAGKSGDDLQWVGGTQFALSTRNGRILHTAGFPHNLGGVVADSPAEAPVRIYRYDFPDISAYGVIVTCSAQDVGGEQLVLLQVAHDTRHVVEACSAPQLDWEFTNEFWQTGGTVWRSIQYIHPGLGPVVLETLRPAA